MYVCVQLQLAVTLLISTSYLTCLRVPTDIRSSDVLLHSSNYLLVWLNQSFRRQYWNGA